VIVAGPDHLEGSVVASMDHFSRSQDVLLLSAITHQGTNDAANDAEPRMLALLKLPQRRALWLGCHMANLPVCKIP